MHRDNYFVMCVYKSCKKHTLKTLLQGCYYKDELAQLRWRLSCKQLWI